MSTTASSTSQVTSATQPIQQSVTTALPTSQVTSTTQALQQSIMTNIGMFTPNQQFPELDLKNPHNSFQTFDMFVKLYKITDHDHIYCNFIKKLPVRILELVRDKIDENLPAKEKLIQAKDVIINHINNSGRNSLDLLLSAEKRPDVTYSEFLRTLKNLGNAANAGQNIIKNRFLEKVADKTHFALAMTLLRKESLETVAEVLDAATRDTGDDTGIFAINNTNPNHKKFEDTNHNQKCMSRLDETEKQMGTLTTAVATMSIKIEKILNNLERNAEDNRMRNPYQTRYNQQQYTPNRYNNTPTYNNSHPQNYNRTTKPPLIPTTNPPHRWGQNSSTQNSNRTCYYHSRYGQNAYNCESPCRFEKPSNQKNYQSTV